MDELGDIEARGKANAANLRRAFGAPVGGEPPAFGALLRRLAAKAEACPGMGPGLGPGAPALAGSLRAAWSPSPADT